MKQIIEIGRLRAARGAYGGKPKSLLEGVGCQTSDMEALRWGLKSTVRVTTGLAG
jgi:hypothetical protein